MKKIKIFALSLYLAVTTSCNDDFVNTQPLSQVIAGRRLDGCRIG